MIPDNSVVLVSGRIEVLQVSVNKYQWITDKLILRKSMQLELMGFT